MAKTLLKKKIKTLNDGSREEVLDLSRTLDKTRDLDTKLRQVEYLLEVLMNGANHEKEMSHVIDMGGISSLKQYECGGGLSKEAIDRFHFVRAEARKENQARGDRKRGQEVVKRGTRGFRFGNYGDRKSGGGGGGFGKKKGKCHKCGSYGHFERECPVK